MWSNAGMRVRTAGDATDVAFAAWYRDEIGSLRTLAAALTGSGESGADLADEAMLRAYRAWERVALLDRPGAWARRVVINLAIDVHRRAVRERRALGRIRLVEASVALESPDDEFWSAVRALPRVQRSAVALFYVDDLSIDEIAEVLSLSTGTVKKALFQARRALARVLQLDPEVTT